MVKKIREILKIEKPKIKEKCCRKKKTKNHVRRENYDLSAIITLLIYMPSFIVLNTLFLQKITQFLKHLSSLLQDSPSNITSSSIFSALHA